MAWPSAVESVLVSLVGMIDTMMVGTIGHEAIAAVGLTTQPRFVFLSIVISLNIGVTAVVARKRGEEDSEGAGNVLRQAIVISVIISLLSTLVGIIFAEPIMGFAGAGPDTIKDSVDYFRIIMAGMLFNSLLLTINAAQRGVGKTRIAMKTNLIANGVNIVLNYLLIGGNFGFPRLGVKGAAIATVVGFFVGSMVSLLSILNREAFLSVFSGKSWALRKETLRSVWFVGSSALVEQLCLRVGFLAYAKIVASLGTAAFATHQICSNILNISFGVGDGLSAAGSALVGQSLGAKRPDMAIIYGKVGSRLAIILSCGLMVFFVTTRRYLMMAFTAETAIIETGMLLVIIIGFICFFQTSQVVFMGCLRGAGDTRFSALVSLVSVAIIRPLFAWLFCYPLGLGLVGAWLSMSIDQIIRLALGVARFSGGKWTKLKL